MATYVSFCRKEQRLPTPGQLFKLTFDNVVAILRFKFVVVLLFFLAAILTEFNQYYVQSALILEQKNRILFADTSKDTARF